MRFSLPSKGFFLSECVPLFYANSPLKHLYECLKIVYNHGGFFRFMSAASRVMTDGVCSVGVVSCWPAPAHYNFYFKLVVLTTMSISNWVYSRQCLFQTGCAHDNVYFQLVELMTLSISNWLFS